MCVMRVCVVVVEVSVMPMPATTPQPQYNTPPTTLQDTCGGSSHVGIRTTRQRACIKGSMMSKMPGTSATVAGRIPSYKSREMSVPEPSRVKISCGE